MKEDDETPPRRAPARYELGQPIEALSIAELDERVVELLAEIARLEAARDAKQAANTAADAFFKT